jgi:biotin-(acetyl-CoA carboxylase) ligase
VILRPLIPLSETPKLTLLAAVAAAEALETQTVCPSGSSGPTISWQMVANWPESLLKSARKWKPWILRSSEWV